MGLLDDLLDATEAMKKASDALKRQSKIDEFEKEVKGLFTEPVFDALGGRFTVDGQHANPEVRFRWEYEGTKFTLKQIPNDISKRDRWGNVIEVTFPVGSWELEMGNSKTFNYRWFNYLYGQDKATREDILLKMAQLRKKEG